MDKATPDRHSVRIALVWRGGPDDPPSPKTKRFDPVINALSELGARVDVVPFEEARLNDIAAQLSACAGVLVWVDPVDPRGDRSKLDPLLRDLAAAGVWIGADPDVISKMGAKSVLFDTKALGWGVDTRMHRSSRNLKTSLSVELSDGPRVIKRNRGNGGQGVWKVSASPKGGQFVEVLEAQRGSGQETLALTDFVRRFDAEFAAFGFVIDQPFQPRLADGMVRCYVCGSKVVGFGCQAITALLWPPAEPGPRIMHPADYGPLADLRQRMQEDWIPAMRRRLNIGERELPALWDADFLYGPKTEAGEDTFVLCEINASSVAPFPDGAVMPLSLAAVAGGRATSR